MAYIYQIINDINDKIYIGQTVLTLEERFYHHCKDINKTATKKRPLYRAMKKYGKEHFFIELIEECPIEKLNEREQYWIAKKDTYHNGYNATIGGDGKRLIDYQKIIDDYKITLNQKQTAKNCNCSVDTVQLACKIYDIPILQHGITPTTKPVAQYDKNNNYIQSFLSCGEAARFLIDSNITQAKIGTVINKIVECAEGKYNRKSAYGYIWKKVI